MWITSQPLCVRFEWERCCRRTCPLSCRSGCTKAWARAWPWQLQALWMSKTFRLELEGIPTDASQPVGFTGGGVDVEKVHRANSAMSVPLLNQNRTIWVCLCTALARHHQRSMLQYHQAPCRDLQIVSTPPSAPLDTRYLVGHLASTTRNRRAARMGSSVTTVIFADGNVIPEVAEPALTGRRLSLFSLQKNGVLYKMRVIAEAMLGSFNSRTQL
ncbi:unnamed protein product [Symbiodinium pilosum]|uniref:Uncharacterized protein n=1 Tax=Symbiodinium pilosum TaxID=2952 RepID=A0A812T019_SYMPI|nr:unnamed protein product [Symbiodinium pilosum]